MLEWFLNNWLLLIGIALSIVVVVSALLYRRKGVTHADLTAGDSLLYDSSVEAMADGAIVIKGDLEWYEMLREEIERLPVGKVTFNPPSTMKLGIKERIETRMALYGFQAVSVAVDRGGIP